MTNNGCHICAFSASATDAQIVYREGGWTAASMIAVPGWVMLFPDRHNEGVWELKPDEGEQFGRLMVLLSGALRQVCDAERVYVMYAGENALHFHVMLMARTGDVPKEWWGAGLLDHHPDLADPDRTNSVLTALRENLAAPSI